MIAGSVYVFCGANYTNPATYINFIEKLQLKAIPQRSVATLAWQLIPEKNRSTLGERAYPVIQPLNESEILIMGGHVANGNSVFNDILIFDKTSNIYYI